MKSFHVLAIASVVAASGILAIVGRDSNTTADATTQQSPARAVKKIVSKEHDKTGAGMAALERAAQANKYLFALFWKVESDQTAAMRTTLQSVVETAADRADLVEVNVTDPTEMPIVDKFDLDRAPMPLILALAPNGAVTGGFPTKVDEQSLMDAFATPCTAECMKCLQENKLVFLCVQNAATESNEEAMLGVKDFAADDRFRAAAKIIMLDPSDEAEKPFLTDLQVDATTKTAVTVFLAPPGSPIAMYEGATNKSEFLQMLQKAGSCGPGGVCGPGGCGPQ